MLIVDNCSLLVASKLNEFWIKIWIKVLAIAPYYLNLNPIEIVTLSIKSITRPYLSEVNSLNLKILQNSIDNTAVEIYRDLLRQVIKKLFKKWEH